MVKLFALWTEPNDVEGFTADYTATHVKMCHALPGIQDVRTGQALPGGPYHRVSELVFPDLETAMAALGGTEGADLLGDSTRLSETFGNKVDVAIVPFE